MMWEQARDEREWQEAHPDWVGPYSESDDEDESGKDAGDWEDGTPLAPRHAHAFGSDMAGPSSAGAGPSGVSHDE
jgi:hypothetical protein